MFSLINFKSYNYICTGGGDYKDASFWNLKPYRSTFLEPKRGDLFFEIKFKTL